MLLKYNITFEPIACPETDRMPAKVKEQMNRLHFQVQSDPEKTLEELPELIRQYPKVKCLYNWLCNCYRMLDDEARARDICEALMRDHPNYLFGRTTLAEILMDSGDIAGAEKLIIGPGLALQLLYPETEVFHISEVRAWHFVTAKLNLMKGDVEQARIHRDIIFELEPDSPIVGALDSMINPPNGFMGKLIGALARLVDEGEARSLKAKERAARKSQTIAADPTQDLFAGR